MTNENQPSYEDVNGNKLLKELILHESKQYCHYYAYLSKNYFIMW